MWLESWNSHFLSLQYCCDRHPSAEKDYAEQCFCWGGGIGLGRWQRIKALGLFSFLAAVLCCVSATQQVASASPERKTQLGTSWIRCFTQSHHCLINCKMVPPLLFSFPAYLCSTHRHKKCQVLSKWYKPTIAKLAQHCHPEPLWPVAKVQYRLRTLLLLSVWFTWCPKGALWLVQKKLQKGVRGLLYETG